MGPYPILQFGFAVIVMVGATVGVIAWLRGEKWGKAAEKEQSPSRSPAAEIYFDGPLKAIFDVLAWVKDRLTLLRLEMKDDIAAMMATSRHAIIDKMSSSKAEISSGVDEAIRDLEGRLNDKFRDLNQNVDAVHSRLNATDQSLTRIDTRISAMETQLQRPRR